MKPFIFVSDFDGTLTKKDFYWILIEKYVPELGKQLFSEWQQGKIKDVEYLGIVFKSANRTESELFEDIMEIDLDAYFEQFVSEVKKSGGDFLILSAGTSYYIEKLFEHMGIKDVEIISNKGVYKDKGIHLLVDDKSEFYSETYGVDKGFVIKSLKARYKKVYFAGDSRPDVEAAKAADTAFATKRLCRMLEVEGQKYIPFNSFKEISDYLKNAGVLK